MMMKSRLAIGSSNECGKDDDAHHFERTAGVLLLSKEHSTEQPSQPIEKEEKKNLKLFPIFSNKVPHSPILKPLKSVGSL